MFVMPTSSLVIEVKINAIVLDIPEAHRLEAETKAKEAYVMTLLKYHDISAGRAAELLNIDRWQLSDLMSLYDISPFDDSMSLEEFQNEVNQTKIELEKEQH